MPASAPLVSITISREDTLLVTFESVGEEPFTVHTNLSPENLEPYRARFYKELAEFVETMNIGLAVTDYYKVTEAMHRLHKAGRKLNLQLFGQRRYEVEGFFNRVWPGWRLLSKDTYVPPLVQVSGRIDDMLPFEFLPLFDTSFPPPVNNTGDLLLLAARFLGFSTIIQRVPTPPQGLAPVPAVLGSVIENTPRLPVRFFHHAGLTGAQREREFFQTTNWVELRGPWPTDSLSEEEFVVLLAKKMWDANDPTPLGASQVMDQIQHFSCHCDTDKDEFSDYSLQLLDRARFFAGHAERSITIDDLEGEFGGLPKRRPATTYPLIFLNACGASKLTPKGVTSFPKLFLEIGNRGVIGTEASVPDIFAAEFSKLFYTVLIEGKSVGESVYFARREFLKYNDNPLGILYTVYADPDLRVRHPM
jgi:hypothetical protein